MGPYIYTPASAYSSPTADGTLSREGVPVALRVTEPLLQEFLNVLRKLEADLVERWGGLDPERARIAGQMITVS